MPSFDYDIYDDNDESYSIRQWADVLYTYPPVYIYVCPEYGILEDFPPPPVRYRTVLFRTDTGTYT